MLKQSIITNRDNFGHLLNRMDLLGDGVEVGTHRGVFAKQILDHWLGNVLYCVDPWCVPPGYEEQAKELDGSNGNRGDDYLCTLNSLRLHPQKRWKLIREMSAEACPPFRDDSLDFVYIDGDHRYSEVRDDLKRWWTKVKPGGILAGHDFLHGTACSSVQPAVMDFSKFMDLDTHIIVESACLPWSFYFIKE